ncbi:hypothetical protein CCB80_01915 [Armatimonadetes bacterium Uphvl-Ar1]|nr:hypothetical protein CCB80_01915 [Armatimonadetes bacterium Uphvl-Ar1]
MKAAFLTIALGLGMAGCAGDGVETDASSAPVPAVEVPAQNGVKGQFEKFIALVDGLPEDVRATADVRREEWTAGMKANLIGAGEVFLPEAEKLLADAWDLGEFDFSTLSWAEEDEESEELAAQMSNSAKAKVGSKFLMALSEAAEEGGSYELSARAIAANRKLSERLLGSNRVLIENLVALAISSISERTARLVAIRGSFGEAEFKILQGVDKDYRKALADALRREWAGGLIPSLEKAKVPETGDMAGAKFDQEATLAFAKQYIAVALEEVEGTGLSLDKANQLMKEFLGEIPEEAEEKWLKAQPNGYGKALILDSLPVFGQALNAAVKSEASEGLTEVVLAAQRGLSETGKLPETVAELRKFGLKDGVVDPYTGKDFGYNPVRGVAWSVGPDGVDDGGLDKEEDWSERAKDRVVRVK